MLLVASFKMHIWEPTQTKGVYPQVTFTNPETRLIMRNFCTAMQIPRVSILDVYVFYKEGTLADNFSRQAILTEKISAHITMQNFFCNSRGPHFEATEKSTAPCWRKMEGFIFLGMHTSGSFFFQDLRQAAVTKTTNLMIS